MTGSGSDSLTVCASGGSCNTFYATVVASQAATNTETASASALLSAIQSMQSELSQTVTQIQSMATSLTQAASALTAGANNGTASNTTTTASSTTNSGTTTGPYDFTEFLSVGSADQEVEDLQQYLTTKGYFTGPVTGYYGALTQAAVAAYQTAHGINPAGYVGPSTRAAMNAGE